MNQKIRRGYTIKENKRLLSHGEIAEITLDEEIITKAVLEDEETKS